MLKILIMMPYLTTLTSIYSSLGMQNKAEEIVNAALAKNPNSYGALVMLGQFAKSEEGI